MRAQLHLKAAQEHRAQQRCGYTFSGYICEHSEEFARLEFQKIVKVAADVARRFRGRVDVQILDLRQALRQQRSLSLFGERKLLLELFSLLDGFDHFEPFQDVAGFNGELVENALIEAGK